MLKSVLSRCGAVVFSIIFMVPATTQAQLVRIGAAGGVRGKITALAPAPGAVARIMSSGKPVYFNDKVKSGPDGRMQVMLLDETVFTLGPNSEMYIDKFVYNPATGVGKVTASVTKGVFRFVTGKIAKNKPSNMKVRLPVGVIGIRGTIVVGEVKGKESLVVLAGPGKRNRAGENAGALNVTNAGKTQNIDTPGFGTILKPGQAPGKPFLVPAERMAGINKALGTKPGDSSKKGAGGGKGASKGSPSSDSGQDSASALGTLDDTETVGALVTANNAETNQAARDAAEAGATGDGITTWDALRNAFPSGSASYLDVSVGSYSCSGGGLCSAPSSGDVHFHFPVNWTTRQFGAGGAHIYFNGGALNSQEMLIPSISFSALTGDAKLTFGDGTGGTVNVANTNFYYTTMQFETKDGTVGKIATTDITWAAGSDTATGSAQADYVP